MKRRFAAILFLVLALLSSVVIVYVLRGEQSSREGKLYPFQPEDISTLDIVSPEQRSRLTYEDGMWSLVAPVRDIADRDLMLRIFGVLHSEKWPSTAGLITDSNLDELGLAQPDLELWLHRKSAVDTLRFGNLDASTQKLWASASWTDSLLQVPTLLRTHFLRNRYDLTDKRPVLIERALDVHSLQVENAYGAYVLRRNDFGWEILAGDVFPADQIKVLGLLTTMSGASILDFLDGEGPRPLDLVDSSPLATLELYLEGETVPERLNIGRHFHQLYLSSNPRRGSPFLLDSLVCAPLFSPLTAYLPDKLFEIIPGRVEWIASGRHRVERAEGPEQVWMDEHGERFELRRLSQIIAFLSEISTGMVEALRPRQDQLLQWGFHEPETVITFAERGRDLCLEIGSPRDGRRYFRRLDYPIVYSLPQEALVLRWPAAQVH
ncbi:DUF4340 domain-containing protein [bacterium]|nr:DUF4340 domain-containing protein [bacterium]